MDISIVLPVYNEEKKRGRSHGSTFLPILDSLNVDYEIIFVDDGSTDGSKKNIQVLHTLHPQVKMISLTRNFGHQMALTVGMDYASGNAVITMDSDLQHSPEIIPTLVATWREGYDVVYTVRKSGDGFSWFKKINVSFFLQNISMDDGR